MQEKKNKKIIHEEIKYSLSLEVAKKFYHWKTIIYYKNMNLYINVENKMYKIIKIKNYVTTKDKQ